MKKQDKSGAGCLVLFGLPFAGVGVFMAWLAFSTVLNWHATQSWVEVPAQIVQADLKVQRDSDSTTYRVAAEYTYTYHGQGYTGTRVGLSDRADNVGSFHQKAHKELARYQANGQAFRCFVNPATPSESVLYRNLRWELLMFYSVFIVASGGVGFGLMGLGFTGARTKRTESLRRAQYPDQPWLWKEAWTDGIVKSNTKVALFATLFFAVLWNAIAIPVGVLVFNEAVLGDGNRTALIGLLFPAVGLLLIASSVYLALRWRKFGSTQFRMAEMPGVLGGKLSGVIETPTNIRPEDGFHLTLSCINRHVTGSGKNRRTQERVLWQDTRVVARELLESDPTRTEIPVAFAIPYDCRATDDSDSANAILWRLEAKAAVPGVDFQAQFEVPVFKTEASSPDFALDETPLAQYLAPSDPLDQLAASGARVTPLSGGGVRMEFPMARQKGVAIGLTTFLAIWTGGILFMIKVDAPVLFPIVFGLLDLLIFYFVLDLWFNETRVEARFQVLAFYGGLFGTGRLHSLRFDDIKSIKPVRGMQSGSKLYYKIEVKTTAGKTYTLAKFIDGLKPAETIAKTLLEALCGGEVKP